MPTYIDAAKQKIDQQAAEIAALTDKLEKAREAMRRLADDNNYIVFDGKVWWRGDRNRFPHEFSARVLEEIK